MDDPEEDLIEDPELFTDEDDLTEEEELLEALWEPVLTVAPEL